MARQPSGCSRGCLVALLVVGALGLLVGLVGVIVVWRAASSEEGQKVMKALGKGASLASKGLNGPGAKEVREAGCPEAFVLDTNEMLDLVDLFTDGGSRHHETSMMVMCQSSFGTLPDCGAVARAYASASGRPPGDFVVMVKSKNQKQELCARRYSHAGDDLGAFNPTRSQ